MSNSSKSSSPSRRALLRTSLAGGAAVMLPKSARADTIAAGAVREYWIQVDSFPHNLVPTGTDAMMGASFTANQTSYGALGYRAYSSNWGAPLPGNSDIGANTGIPGPVIRAMVGDTIRIHFRNNDKHFGFPHSIHAHGVAYTPENDGAYVAANPTAGASVAFGDSFTYEYAVTPTSVGTWPYHDHSVPQVLKSSDSMDVELNVQLGMMGVIVITNANTVQPDVENILVMHDLYASAVPGLAQDFDCFNGYAYLGNTPAFQAQVGQRVRWRVVAFGKEFHAFHLHGHRWLRDGRYVDTEVLGPATTLTFDYVEDSPGQWLYHCHVSDHMAGGMVGYYVVSA